MNKAEVVKKPVEDLRRTWYNWYSYLIVEISFVKIEESE